MKKFLLTVFFLVIFIVGGIGFFIIRSFNADNFQKQIIKAVSEATGREFNVLGTTYVSWIPSPEIILNDVTLSNLKGSNQFVMLRAPKIAIQLTWKSILNTPIIVDKIRVEDPVLYLERIDATKVNWDFDFLSRQEYENTVLGLNKKFSQTRIDNLEIRNGQINYQNAMTGKQIDLKQVNGRFKLDTLRGPFSFDGSFSKADVDYLASMSVNQLNPDAQVPFSLKLNAKDKSIHLDLNGDLLVQTAYNIDLVANGSFSIQKPNEILKDFRLQLLDNSLNIPSSGSLTYISKKGVSSLDNFTVRFGDQEDSVAINGSFASEYVDNLPNYNMTLAINKFDYMQWKNWIDYLKKYDLNDDKSPNFSLKFNAHTIKYDNQSVSDVSMHLEKKQNRLIIPMLKGVMDGNTTLSATGGTYMQDSNVGASFTFTGVSNDFKTLISPFVDVSKLSDGVLKSAKFDGSINILSNTYDIDIQSFESSGSTLSGKINIIDEAKPVIDLTAKLENVNIDQFIGYKKGKEKINLTSLIPNLKNYFKELKWFSKYNGKFDLDLKDITFMNLPISKAKVAGSVLDNSLKLTEFRANGLASSTILATAELANVSTENVNFNNLNIEFATKEGKLFLDRAQLVSSNDYINQSENIALSLQLEEDKNNWKTSLNSKIDDLEASLNGTVLNDNNDFQLKDMTLDLTYSSFQQFLKDVMKTTKIHNSLEGLFKLQGVLNGTLKDMKFKDTTIQVGLNSLDVAGQIQNSTAQKSIEMNVKTPSLNLDKYILNEFQPLFETGERSKQKVDFSLLDLWKIKLSLDAGQVLYKNKDLRDVHVDLNIQDKMLSVSDFNASVTDATTSIKGTGSLSWTGVPHLSADFSISNYKLPANLLSGNKNAFGTGIMSLNTSLQTHGQSAHDMRLNLSGSGKVNIENTLWIGADIQKITPLISQTIKNRLPKNEFDTAMNRYLHSGKTNISSFAGDFTIEKGVLKMLDASLKADSFYSNPMQVIYNIPNSSLDVSVPITLASYTDLPPFALSVKGTKSNPSYTVNFVDLSNSVDDIVQKGNTQIAQELKKQQEQLQKITLSERQEKISQAINDARNSVKIAEEKLFSGDNETALFILQSAKDALSVVNQLSVKETLTDAEFIQLMEKARLTVLKAQEAINEAVQDLYFEDRKQVQAFVKQSKEILQRIEEIHQQQPYIEIVEKLIPPVREYAEELVLLDKSFTINVSQEEHALIMQKARDAFSKIVRAYEYVSRFDSDEGERIEPITSEKIPNKNMLLTDDVENNQEEDETVEYVEPEESSFKGSIERL